MKTKTARYALMTMTAGLAFSVVFAAACVNSTGDGVYSVRAESECALPIETKLDCDSEAARVAADLIEIVSGYNDTEESDSEWSASSIEYYAPAYIVEDEEYGVYFDFDGDNGYAVIKPDKTIYGLNTRGDLANLRESDVDLYYSYIDGFMFKAADGELLQFVMPEYDNSDYVSGNTGTVVYPGQSEAGDGKINPAYIDQYVIKRYPLDFYEKRNLNMSIGYNCVTQYETSYYVKCYADSNKKPSGWTVSEGNCVLHAMYNVMRSWDKAAYVSLDSTKTHDLRTNIKQDPYYMVFSNSTFLREKDPVDDKHTYYKWETNSDNYLQYMPKLYSEIRDFALKRNYTVDGYYFKYIPETMEYVANVTHDNDITVKRTTKPSDVFNSINKHRSCVMGINDSSTYGNHAVAVMGYYSYYKEVYVSKDYTNKVYHYFYLIDDGWRGDLQVFDPNTSANPSLEFFYLLSRC